LTLVCPECYTANAAAARFCSGCGGPFRAKEVKERRTGRNCPDCGIELLRRSLVDQEIAECPNCNGMWVDRHAFQELVDRASAREAAKEIRSYASRRQKPPLISKEGGKGIQYRKCPECGAMMHRKRFKRISDVVMDECAIHGVWLEADELASIARFVVEGGLALAEAHEARERSADAEHVVIVTSYDADPTSTAELPEELLADLAAQDVDEIEQEIVIEHDDGRIERRRRTIRPGDDDFESAFKSLFKEES
jgi:Zn-finger nucleic acid-binding protein